MPMSTHDCPWIISVRRTGRSSYRYGAKNQKCFNDMNIEYVRVGFLQYLSSRTRPKSRCYAHRNTQIEETRSH